jgi:hypothetical protein
MTVRLSLEELASDLEVGNYPTLVIVLRVLPPPERTEPRFQSQHPI